MVKVNVGTFWDPTLPNKVSVANSMPKGVEFRTLKQLLPEWKYVDAYKKGLITWDEYTDRYADTLNDRLPELPGEDYRDLVVPERLAYLLRSAAKSLGVDEITLCCWEKADDPHCHRKLIHSWLPDEMKGECR